MNEKSTAGHSVLNRDQSRAIDRIAVERYGMTGLVLMENAGRGVADLLREFRPRGSVVVCCGKGNNAGDGFVIARHLRLGDVPVRVLLLSDSSELTGDAAANFNILQKTDVPIDLFARPFDAEKFQAVVNAAEWIVDALLGTGAKGDPRPPFDEAIRRMNAAPAKKLAVDLPSGLDCDSGRPASSTVRADVTATFVALKIGFQNPAARPFTGQVRVLGIGVPQTIIAEAMG